MDLLSQVVMIVVFLLLSAWRWHCVSSVDRTLGLPESCKNRSELIIVLQMYATLHLLVNKMTPLVFRESKTPQPPPCHVYILYRQWYSKSVVQFMCDAYLCSISLVSDYICVLLYMNSIDADCVSHIM